MDTQGGGRKLSAQTIDGRCMSRMSDDVRIVHIRLEAWGRWAKEGMPGALPARTLLGRVIDEGPGAGQSQHQLGEMPEPIAQTDRAVAHLPHEDRKVIRTYYLHWQPRELLAEHANMSMRRFDAVLNRARWRLCGWLQHE